MRAKRSLIFIVLLVVMGYAAARAQDRYYGSIPMWAEAPRVYRADNQGRQHWLAEVTGCTSDQVLTADQTVQCRESFLYIQPEARMNRAIGTISNVQVAGYAADVRANDSRIGTVGEGRIDRAVRYDGLCYGNVGECVGLRAEEIEFMNGFKLRSTDDRLELIAPDGTVRQSW